MAIISSVFYSAWRRYFGRRAFAGAAEAVCEGGGAARQGRAERSIDQKGKERRRRRSRRRRRRTTSGPLCLGSRLGGLLHLLVLLLLPFLATLPPKATTRQNTSINHRWRDNSPVYPFRPRSHIPHIVNFIPHTLSYLNIPRLMFKTIISLSKSILQNRIQKKPIDKNTGTFHNTIPFN